MIVVRDHKTNGTIASAESLDDLLDSQLHLYAWGVSVHLGINVGAVGYDRARSKPAAQPAVTKAGKLSASAQAYEPHAYPPVPHDTANRADSEEGTRGYES